MQSSHMIAFVIFLYSFTIINAAPTPQSLDKTANGTANKGAFNTAFDEILVESKLTVRGKSSGPRQGRKLEVIPANENITVKTSLSDASSSTTGKTSS